MRLALRRMWRRDGASRVAEEARMRGKVVIVTGASSGIGLATARLLAGRGSAVVATARRADRLADLAAEAERRGGRILAVPADITSSEERARIVSAALGEFGRIDALVNNAGYGRRGPVEIVPLEEVRRNFETNLFGLIGLTQLVVPELRRAGGGRIVNVSSVAGRVAWPFSSVYGATKHALEAISDGLRAELARFGIRVVVVQPGLVRTEFGAVAEASSRVPPEATVLYGLGTAGAKRRLDAMRRFAATPEAIADLIRHALAVECPRPRYAAPLHARALLLFRRAAPDSVLDGVLQARAGRD
ncbi:MAG: SDR family oxidoreductase [Gemmatimonadetes bacterium]|nr:SDR family oxidoreductase [Gemmatimonadota bacterium]